eukprot:7989220-Prorocentrum_lima.AAC.1
MCFKLSRCRHFHMSVMRGVSSPPKENRALVLIWCENELAPGSHWDSPSPRPVFSLGTINIDVELTCRWSTSMVGHQSQQD